ncbi:DUF1129 family protein [Weissella soli]|uniref:Putative membrane-anchored protein n=1 Tax=Weissella soli TaxID=155866 RepID=A0A288Q7D9_9LACO|nr:DUF1129 family protein [Weissella soli]AOT55674.1 hypothetical protein WSWS_00012 [Weissella soli]MCT8394311.1 DUF1129 family protein [Weissella soli]NKY83801.1 DUF1129 family protein [Weissella soli]QEA35384.1 DUF1129 family protein [Weissella soli]RDL06652.1 putative membrane-anchored protein [Weissella soli]
MSEEENKVTEQTTTEQQDATQSVVAEAKKAPVSEQPVAPVFPTRADLAASGLTKRNQNFVYAVTKLATNEKTQAPVIADIAAKLLAAQKKGTTAQQLFGTPAEALGIQVNETAQRTRPANNYANVKYRDLAIDNTLTFLMLFSFMFGLTLLFSKVGNAQGAGAAGITSLILTSVTGGLLFALVTKLMADDKIKRFYRIIGSILAFVLWFGIYMLLSILPAVINPVLPGWLYITLAVAAFFGFREWRKRTGISGGFLGSAPANRK